MGVLDDILAVLSREVESDLLALGNPNSLNRRYGLGPIKVPSTKLHLRHVSPAFGLVVHA